VASLIPDFTNDISNDDSTVDVKGIGCTEIT